MPRTTNRRPSRRILEATIAASLLGAAPSLLYTLSRDGIGGAWSYGLRATRAIASLTPFRHPALIAGAAAHFGISAACGQALGRLLPLRHSVLWGAASGAAMGFLGAGLIGHRVPAIRELPFGRQLADNVAFGVIFALVADRSGSEPSLTSGEWADGETARRSACSFTPFGRALPPVSDP